MSQNYLKYTLHDCYISIAENTKRRRLGINAKSKRRNRCATVVYVSINV